MGYEKYQAKKTYYNGTWYDSNLEAKTAEALDGLGIVYEYHRQCFRDKRFPYGQYTPDFHLPNTDTYVEVCAVFDDRHQRNVEVLCKLMYEGTDTRSRMVTVGGQLGFTMGFWMDADGTMHNAPVAWKADDGTKSTDLFWLAENHPNVRA